MSLRSDLEEMIVSFEGVSSQLVRVTSREIYTVTAEKSIYGKLFGQPSSRLSTLLSVDREILVLFSAFATQQIRTVKAVSKIIKDSDGRLEPTVAIIVHSDRAGNVKLKKWGREYGITVLPIYYSKERFPATPDEFETALCRELFSYDPFDIVGPVSDDQQFYGRRTEAQDLARQLQMGQVKCCLGIRKVGKTSLVNRVIDICKTHHDCYLVVIDCSNDGVWSMSSTQMMMSLAESLHTARSRPDGYCTLIRGDMDQTDMIQASERLSAEISVCEKPIVFVFDEIDY